MSNCHTTDQYNGPVQSALSYIKSGSSTKNAELGKARSIPTCSSRSPGANLYVGQFQMVGLNCLPARLSTDLLPTTVPASCAYTHVVVALQPTLLALAGGRGIEGSAG